MGRTLRTMRAGGKGGDGHHLASLSDSKYRQYGDSCGFTLVIVNLRIEATAFFFQLWLPTIAMKTLRTKPRICLSRFDPN